MSSSRRTDSAWFSTTAAIGTPTSACRMASIRSPVAPVGRTSAMTACTFSSAATSSRHCRKASPDIAAVVSTGPAIAPSLPISARSSPTVVPPGRCTVRPRPAHASAASAPAPPMLDTIATVRPAGTGWVASSAAVFDQLAQAGRGDDAHLLEQCLAAGQRGRGRVRWADVLVGRERSGVRAAVSGPRPAAPSGRTCGDCRTTRCRARPAWSPRPVPTTGACRCWTRRACARPTRTGSCRCRASTADRPPPGRRRRTA